MDNNCVRGRIGESIYLGEVAQYGFVTSGPVLKIFELNPRHVNTSGGMGEELFACVERQDVVVLER
jgi:iron(III) transport system ATP-binding protein